ncbi:hypothetical protein ACTXT7_008536 [Hymenolepis weldensis]
MEKFINQESTKTSSLQQCIEEKVISSVKIIYERLLFLAATLTNLKMLKLRVYSTCSPYQLIDLFSQCIEDLLTHISALTVNEQRTRIRSTTLSYFIWSVSHNPDYPPSMLTPSSFPSNPSSFFLLSSLINS